MCTNKRLQGVLVEKFIEFLENLNCKGLSTLNLLRVDDKDIHFQGEIPKEELGAFLLRMRKEGGSK